MVQKLNISDFLELSKSIPVVDVRSPREFETGHFPGAVNIPLFDNEERALVGTVYKQISRNTAVLKGLEIVGPKMKPFAEKAQELAINNQLLVYCWRGGMRSASMAWLFEMVGIKTYTLSGGYKSFRRYGKSKLSGAQKIIILGGLTGSGKTETLHKIREKGEQVIDLEKLANHKGSAFGALGQEKQPSNEQFENNLIYQYLQLDASRPIWLEDESHSIGTNWIPGELFDIMRQAPVLKMEIAKSIRIKRLVAEYAGFDPAFLEECILKIGKRLGGQHVKQALERLKSGHLDDVADITLTYYDKSYSFGVDSREKNTVFPVALEQDDPGKNAETLIEFAKTTILHR
ncbi:MAG: tRNA 2-selenouridine(34) synthase MnmH [Bacteroidetes bacterium GWC2_33_15]|nr:MAG: tRNA 2-selenouridine(34) synthase MnmH [Bacteroidetes bacterium GWA2_33_15]OFX49776.1 MAG: tRNA 2-selenouridine(34) synthase MnmH [Bacteroidetes bacterium GWC2_33_15]OFX64967.1 MAG: tRNA 2-selenouridine(34) synthase MnmH [Bacteroidetes bacterium GWB2_32_14]OFX69071.1 MAG: tRNA 2-selenouridine(34) synthase MnmH [Bacteroidetes bacterium GWD2_33_33]HAN18341.1 tRNA 2-selenouridine(34) synthase MnmH [Bacteroidales bacterium]